VRLPWTAVPRGSADRHPLLCPRAYAVR